MIVDAFMFFNELDILEIRMRELQDVVDLFIVLECGHALSGVHKPYIFEQNKARFTPYINKVHYLKLLGLPPLKDDTEESRFWLESFQRNHLLNGLIEAGVRPDDFVLISDVDEVPSKDSLLKTAHAARRDEVYIFKQIYYKNFFDVELPDNLRGKDWLGPVGALYSIFGSVLPHALRRKIARAGAFYDQSIHGGQNCHYVDYGGWHMTYFGGERASRYKTANFAHGAKNLHGDALVVPSAVISRESLDWLKPFVPELEAQINDLILGRLGGDIPNTVKSHLADYYHLFRLAFSKKPLPWLKD